MKALVFLLAGLLIGGTASALLGLGADPAPADPVVLDSGAGKVDIGPKPVVDAERPEAPEVPEVSEEQMGGFRSLLKEALRAAPRYDIDGGEGVISGTVLTRDGQPLSGVELSLRPSDAPDFVTSDDEAGKVERWILAARWREANGRKTWTGDDGSYVFEGLPNRRWRLSASAEGWKLSTQAQAWRMSNGGKADYTATATGRVPVAVVRADGTSFDKARISITQRNGNGSSSTNQDWSRAKPYLTLEAGTHYLQLEPESDRLESTKSDEVMVRVETGVPVDEVTLVARPVLGIEVRIERPEGMGDPGWSQVSYLRLEQGGDEDPDRLTREGENEGIWRNREAIMLRGLDAGRYLVGLMLNQEIVDHEIVDLTDKAGAITLAFPEPDTNNSILIEARAPDGSPLPGLSFTHSAEHEGSSSSGGTNVTKYVDGRYWIAKTGFEEMLADGARVTFLTQHETFGRGRATGTVPLPEILVLEWTPTASVRVRVPGGKTHEHAGALSVAVHSTEDGEMHGSSISLKQLDSKDEAVINNVATGQARVSLNGEIKTGRHMSSSWSLPINEVTIGTGEQVVSATIPALATLTIAFGEDKEDWPRHLQLSGRVQGSSSPLSAHVWLGDRVIKDDGTVEVGPLPFGEYSLTGGMGGQSMKVNVRGDTRVTWEPESPNAIRVTISDPNGLFASMGFRDGDVIISIDGVSLGEGEEGSLMAFQRIFMSKRKATATVLRGSGQTEVEMNLSRMRRARSNPGGDFQPFRR